MAAQVEAATAFKRYGAGSGANPDVHEAILRGASDCFTRFGVRKTSMDDIAEAAGVSRATVYNYVANKDMLIAELIVHEARRINDEARAQLDLSLDSAELLVEAELLVLDGAVRSPYADVFTSADVVRLTAHAVGHSGSFAEVQREYWTSIFDVLRERGDLLPGLDEDEAIAWMDTISFMLATGPTTFDDDRETQRRHLLRYVAPAFVKPDRKGARKGG